MVIEPFVRDAFSIDEDSQTPLIELAVDRYDDLFNALDAAPHDRRDLATPLKDYLAACADWVPAEVPLTIEITLRAMQRQPELERHVIRGIQHYYEYMARVVDRQMVRRRRRVAGFVAASFAFLGAALTANQQLDTSGVLQSFAVSGLTVGGWIFMWEALALALIRPLDLKAERAHHRRLAEAPIRFR